MSDSLRSKLEKAVYDALRQQGSGLERAPIANLFIAKGVARTTAFRWIQAALDSPVAAEIKAEMGSKIRSAGVSPESHLDPNSEGESGTPAPPAAPDDRCITAFRTAP